jgi:2-dehydropantoate 2-reductase
MKILIVGAGGIGGYFGAKLLLSGADITYLLREKRQQLIEDHGLTIETPTGSFTVHPRSVLADQLEPIYDLIILAPKAFDLDETLKSIGKAAKKGLILPFLNGFTHMQKLDEHFGKGRVMGGVAHIAAMITQSGSVKQLTELHSLTIGPRTPEQTGLAQDFFALCKKADFESFYKEQIEQSLWDKWVFLATLAGMTTICRGSVGNIASAPYGIELSRRMYDECCRIAASLGFAVSDETQNNAIALLTKEGSPFTASMLRDLLALKQAEHEHILGDLIALGANANIDCPLLKIAHTHMVVESANLN